MDILEIKNVTYNYSNSKEKILFSISSFLNRIWPFCGLSSPANNESNVDFPAPDFPIIA